MEENQITITPVESEFKQELAKQNITEAVLAELKERAKHVRILNADDKDGYKEAHALERDCVKLRGIVVRICKKGREEAVKIQKDWIAKENEMVEAIKSIELPVAKMKLDVDTERQRRIDEIKEREEKIFKERVDRLFKLGFTFDGLYYKYGEIVQSPGEIRQMTEDGFLEFAAKSETAIKDFQNAQIAEKKRIEEEQEKLKAEKLRLENISKELEEERKLQRDSKVKRRTEILTLIGFGSSDDDKRFYYENDIAGFVSLDKNLAFEMPEDEFQVNVEGFKKEISDLKQKETDFVRAEADKKEKRSKRFAALYELGLKFDGENFVLEDLNVHNTEILTLDDVGFEVLIDQLKPRAEFIFKAIEENKKKEIEKAKQDAIAAEKKRQEEEADRQRKEQQKKDDELRRQHELAPDKWKLQSLADMIIGVTEQEFTVKDKEAKKIIKTTLDSLTELHQKLALAIQKL